MTAQSTVAMSLWRLDAMDHLANVIVGKVLDLDFAVWTARSLVGWFFIVSGIGKFADIRRFESYVRGYRVTDRKHLIRLISMSIPLLEILIGSGLIATNAVIPVFLSVALLCLFVGLQLQAIWRGLQIECGCLGIFGRQLVSLATVLRTVTLVVTASLPLFIHGISPPSGVLDALGDSIPAAGLLLCGAILVSIWQTSRMETAG